MYSHFILKCLILFLLIVSSIYNILVFYPLKKNHLCYHDSVLIPVVIFQIYNLNIRIGFKHVLHFTCEYVWLCHYSKAKTLPIQTSGILMNSSPDFKKNLAF